MSGAGIKKWLWIPLIAVMGLFVAGCTSKGNAETDFWVRANCEMCQETIETALRQTPGVTEATFNLETNMAHVHYDSTQVKVAGLHQAVANAGYETKLAQASPAAYDALPKCCKKTEDM